MAAWGNRGNAESEFRRLCEQIETSKTSSSSITILRSRFRDIWEKCDCAVSLAKAITSNTSLVEFNCLGLDFSVQGCFELAKALQNNTTLKKLLIGHEKFGDDQANALLHYGKLGKVQFLDLERRNLTSSSAAAIGLAVGNSQGSISVLKLGYNQLGDDGIELLAHGLTRSSHLQTLDLKGNQITAPGVAHLATALKSVGCVLIRLDLSDNPLGSEGVASLSSVDCAELLLDGCRGGDKGCIALVGGKPRELLSLVDNDLTSHGATVVTELAFLGARAEHHILSLRLAKNSDIGNEGMLAIASVLARRRDMFPDANAIRFLDISLIGASKISPHLLTGAVSSLLFVGNGPLDASEVIEALNVDSTLESLSLSGTGINDISAVFRALHTHTSLNTIEFGGIPLNDIAREELRLLLAANPKLDVAVDKGVNDDQRMQ